MKRTLLLACLFFAFAGDGIASELSRRVRTIVVVNPRPATVVIVGR